MPNTHRAYMLDPQTQRRKMIAAGSEEFCIRRAAARSEKTGITCGVTTVDDDSVKLG